MARPFLADAELLSKAQSGRAMRSTPVLAAIRPASIRSSLESHLVPGESSRLPRNQNADPPAVQKKNLAVVGAGPAGLALPLTRRRVVIR